MNSGSINIEELYTEALQKHKAGDYDNAYKLYQQILNIDSKHSDTFFMLGNLFYQNNHMNDSIKFYKLAIELQPQNEKYINGLGKTYLALDLIDNALECFNKALNINPNFINPYLNLGRLYKKQNIIAEAKKYYLKALEIDPASVIANNNMGNIFHAEKNYEKAIKCYETVLKVNPKQAEAHMNLGNVLALNGEKENALASYKNALSLNPNFIDAEYQTIFLRMELCDWSSRQDDISRIIELMDIYERNKSFHSQIPLMNPGYYPLPPEVNLRAAKLNANLYVERVKNLKTKINFTYTRSESRKLRVAYISPDFREHAVGILIYDIFRHFDRNKFEIFAYSLNPNNSSDFYTQKIKGGVDHFIELSDMTIESAAKKINEDQIDILVDLAGHTSNSRVEILALKPAPIQVCYLGFSNTTGSDFIQYLMADRFLISDERSKYYTEKIVYLPQRFISSPLDVSGKEMKRSQFGVPDDKFVFCCFNNIVKLDPDVFKSWMNILHRVPDSVLWLTKPGNTIHGNLLKEINKSGIASDRVIFSSKQPLDEFIARNRLADLFLDTFHYSAGATIVCSLLVGLPVLTLPGVSFTSRLTGSVLKSAGVPELICSSVDEYEDRAVHFANNMNEIENIRKKILINHSTAHLYDRKWFAGKLENAFTKMWEIHKSGKSPESFSID